MVTDRETDLLKLEEVERGVRELRKWLTPWVSKLDMLEAQVASLRRRLVDGLLAGADDVEDIFDDDEEETETG